MNHDKLIKQGQRLWNELWDLLDSFERSTAEDPTTLERAAIRSARETLDATAEVFGEVEEPYTIPRMVIHCRRKD